MDKLIPSFLLTTCTILFCIVTVFGQTSDNNNPDIKYKREVDLTFNYKFSVKQNAGNVLFKARVPGSIKNRQTVNSIKYSIPPDSVYKVGNNSYALYKIRNLEKDLKINIKCNLTIYKYVPEKADTGIQENFSEYLKSERYIETDLPDIKNVAATLKSKSDIETIMNTFFYVEDKVSYKLKSSIGAVSVLESGEGKCTDFSDLFVALLRANKIPAKTIQGAVFSENENPLHQWAEAYSQKQGWIMFDPTTGHMHISQFKKKSSISVKNKYIILCNKRNDPELFNWESCYAYKCADYNDFKIKVTCTLEDH